MAATAEDVRRELIRRELQKRQQPATPDPAEALPQGRNPVGLTPEGTVGAFEVLGTIGSAIAAEPLSGLAGLAALPFGGPEAAADAVRGAQEVLTYQPRTQAGQEAMRRIGGLLAPLGDAFRGVSEASGEAANVALPLVAPGTAAMSPEGRKTIGFTAPTALAELAGFKGITSVRGARRVTGLTDDVVDTLKRSNVDVDDITPRNLSVLQDATEAELANRMRRVEAFENVGIERPTRAQVTRRATDFQAQQEAFKTSTPVREVLEGQERRLAEAVDEVIEATTGNRAPTGMPAIDEVVGRSRALDQQVSGLYGAARDAAQGGTRVFHGGRIEGDLRPLYVTRTKAVAQQIQGGKEIPVREFAIADSANVVDLAPLRELGGALASQGVGTLGAKAADLTEAGADLQRRALSRLRDMDADVVIDSAQRGADEMFVLNPKVLSRPGGDVRPSGLVEALRKRAPSNSATNGLIKSIQGELREQGVLGSKGFKVQGRIGVEQAEEIRKFINSHYNSTTDFGRQVMRDLKDALDDDVFKAAGDDVFRQARTAKAEFEAGLNRAKVSKFDSRKTNLVRDMLENKVSPDTMVDDVVFGKKYRAEDMRQLRDYLNQTPEGQQAWNDLRAETLANLKNRSFQGPQTQDFTGDADFRSLSRRGLETSLAKIQSKRKVLFTPEENKFLDDLLSVSKLREPVPATFQGRGPSAQAIARLQDFIRANPMFSALVDTITLDRRGRAVLRAPVAPQIGTTPRLPAAVAPVATGSGLSTATRE